LAVAAAVIALVVPSTLGQLGAIVLGGVVGVTLRPKIAVNTNVAHIPLAIGRAAGAALLDCFFVLLAGLPWLAASLQIHSLELIDAFYRAGSLVFGGGHVVLPLLQTSVVPPGWVTNDAFLAGYGAAQAVPGPLFTFAAFLGAVMGPQPNGWAGAALCLLAIFLPSFLLVIGTLPFWDALRRHSSVQAALCGVNAAVAGLLLAALYNPVWKAGITSSYDFAMAATAFLLLFNVANAPLARRRLRRCRWSADRELLKFCSVYPSSLACSSVPGQEHRFLQRTACRLPTFALLPKATNRCVHANDRMRQPW
jgi:chromate transporter